MMALQKRTSSLRLDYSSPKKKMMMMMMKEGVDLDERRCRTRPSQRGSCPVSSLKMSLSRSPAENQTVHVRHQRRKS